MNKATITYRFNQDPNHSNKLEVHQEKSALVPLYKDEIQMKENLSEVEVVYGKEPLNQFTTDFGSWSSPIDLETLKLEKLIRETDRSRPMSTPPTIQSGMNYLPEFFNEVDHKPAFYDQIQWSNVVQTKPTYKRSTKTPWFKIISSITGAVITGVIFGFLVLTMFSDEADEVATDTGNRVNVIQEENKENAGAIVQEEIAAANKETMGTVAVNIPPQTYFVLQNGVFATLEGAKTAQTQLKDLGFAAQIESSDKYYVYAGLTTLKDDAELMGYQLKENGLEIFAKSYELPMANQIKWNEVSAEPMVSYLVQGNKLIGLICSLSLAHLQESNLTQLDHAAFQSIMKEHQTWTGLLAAANSGMPDEIKADFQKMNSAINTAIMSLEAYKKNASAGQLWQAQTSILDYVITEKQFLTSLTESVD